MMLFASPRFWRRVPLQACRVVSRVNYSVKFDKLLLVSTEVPLIPSNKTAKIGKDAGDEEKTKLERKIPESFYQPADENLQKALEQVDFKLDFYNKTGISYDASKYDDLKKWLNWIHLRKTVLISLDLEVFELRQNVPLEVGISILDFRKQKNSPFPNFLNLHFIIEEHLSKNNGRFVPNNKNRFINGASCRIRQSEFPSIFSETLKLFCHQDVENNTYDFNNPPPFALVGHYLSADITFLRTCFGIKLPDNIPVIDTSIVAKTTFDTAIVKKSKLSTLLQMCNIPGLYLHNGANDAYYTLILLLKLLDPELRLNVYCKNYHELYNYENWKYLNEKFQWLFDEKPKSVKKKSKKSGVTKDIKKQVIIKDEMSTLDVDNVNVKDGCESSQPENGVEVFKSEEVIETHQKMETTLSENEKDDLDSLEKEQDVIKPVNEESLTPEDKKIRSELIYIKGKIAKKSGQELQPLIQNKNLIGKQYEFGFYDPEIRAVSDFRKSKKSPKNKSSNKSYPPHNELLGSVQLTKNQILEKLRNYSKM